MASSAAQPTGVAYARGSIAAGAIRAAYERYARRGEAGPADALGEMLRAYFDHECTRLLDGFIASSSNAVGDLRELLQAVVRAAFRIGVPGMHERNVGRGEEAVAIRLVYRSSPVPRGGRAAVGTRGQCELGQSFVLGETAAEHVAGLDITTRVSFSQLCLLEEYPELVGYLLDACDRCVPLHLDFRLIFSVRDDDHTFELGNDSRLPRLGITSALGRASPR
jgi:hypothetical protein